MNTYLNIHIVEDKEEIDDLRCHDKDMESTGGLV
jgi:hypothetical protein